MKIRILTFERQKFEFWSNDSSKMGFEMFSSELKHCMYRVVKYKLDLFNFVLFFFGMTYTCKQGAKLNLINGTLIL